MSSSVLPSVLSPITLNGLELPTRTLMNSLHMNMEGDDQYERMADFYGYRARQHIGIMVSAGCAPNDEGAIRKGSFSFHLDSQINDHRIITREVHRNGGRIALQLLHLGREAFHKRLLAPSKHRYKGNIFQPHEITVEQIEQNIEDFGEAARRAREANYDAIEVVCSQGFFIHQFLAVNCNKREDQWGGSLENRFRFAHRVAQSIRSKVGRDYPVIFRVPGLDLLPDAGLELDESLAFIESLIPYGVDLLNVAIGWHESRVPTTPNVVPNAAFSLVSNIIRARFPDLNVSISNRVNDLRTAEALINEGVADMVSMGRPFLADPRIVSKSIDGDFKAVNTCIACNQDCLDNVLGLQVVSCAVNPECGSELEGKSITAPEVKRIAVVGGGLAGLSTAYNLARRNHQVTLYEAESSLGGQINIAKKIPGKWEFARTVEYFTDQLIKLKVPIRLGVRFDEAELAQGWDHVVLASGSRPAHIDVDTDDSVAVLDYKTVLEDQVPVQYPAIIIGSGGVACDLAKYLASAPTVNSNSRAYLREYLNEDTYSDLMASVKAPDRKVILLQRTSRRLGSKLGKTVRWVSLQALEKYNVSCVASTVLDSVRDNKARLRNTLNDEVREIDVKTVVLAVGQNRNTELLTALEAAGISYSSVGAVADKKRKVSISSSIREGYDEGIRI